MERDFNDLPALRAAGCLKAGDQPRDDRGRWTSGQGGGTTPGTKQHAVGHLKNVFDGFKVEMPASDLMHVHAKPERVHNELRARGFKLKTTGPSDFSKDVYTHQDHPGLEFEVADRGTHQGSRQTRIAVNRA